MKILLVLSLMLFVSCKSFRFSEIGAFNHQKCEWLVINKDKKEQFIDCGSVELTYYMIIPIIEYMDFTENYECRDKRKKD